MSRLFGALLFVWGGFFGGVQRVAGNPFFSFLYTPAPTPVAFGHGACKEDTTEYLEHLNGTASWAAKMWQSTSERPGDFNIDQCLTSGAPFPVQYCLTNVEVESNFYDQCPAEGTVVAHDYWKTPPKTFEIGWCGPASCKPPDVEDILQTFAPSINMSDKFGALQFHAKFHDCRSNIVRTDKWFRNLFWLHGIGHIAIILFASMYARYPTKSNNRFKYLFQRALATATLQRSCAHLMEFRHDEFLEPLSVLCALKLIFMVMIIVYHRLGIFTGSVAKNFRSVSTTPLLYSDLFVDSFMIVSVFLSIYPLLRHYERDRTKAFKIFTTKCVKYSLAPLYTYLVFNYAMLLNTHKDVLRKVVLPNGGVLQSSDEALYLTYKMVHVKVVPPIIGACIAFGYYRLRNGNPKLLRRAAFYFVLMCLLLLFVLTSLFMNPFRRNRVADFESSTVLNRAAFAFICGLFLLMTREYANRIYGFISWDIWIPVSKLCFGVYAIHMHFQLRSLVNGQEDLHSSYPKTVFFCISDVVLTFAFAFVVYLFYEGFLKVFVREFLISNEEETKKRPIVAPRIVINMIH